MKIVVTQLVEYSKLTDHEDREVFRGERGTRYHYDVPTIMPVDDESALTWFHDNIAIGCLDDFDISVEHAPAPYKSADNPRHCVNDEELVGEAMGPIAELLRRANLGCPSAHEALSLLTMKLFLIANHAAILETLKDEGIPAPAAL